MWSGDEQLAEHVSPPLPWGPWAEEASPAEVHLLQCSSTNAQCTKCIWERYYYWTSRLQQPVLCVYGAKPILVSRQCGVVPLLLYCLCLGQHPMAPIRTLVPCSRPVWPPRIPSGSWQTFWLPMKHGTSPSEAAVLGSQQKGCFPLPLHTSLRISSLYPLPLNSELPGYL